MELVVRDVSVRLDSTDVLKGVRLEVGEGEVACLLGPNGSGKTTLLRTIYGILKPFSGAVYVNVEEEFVDVKDLGISDTAKLFGYLPQESEDSNLRVIDVVLLGRIPYSSHTFHPSKKDLEIAEKALQMTGMLKFRNKQFSKLSGGEKQKVLLSRILCQEAKILLLDEPTSHLDIRSQVEVMGMIEDMCRNGMSALISTHDVNLATMFCSKVIMIRDGVVRYAGKPEEVITARSIRDVFGIDVDVVRYNGRVVVLPKKSSTRLERRA